MSPLIMHAHPGTGMLAPAERRPLDEMECISLLRDVGWGILAVAGGGPRGAQPYAVPVAYAFDGASVFIAAKPGRKLRMLERNPRLCLTVFEVEAFDSWRSVVITGEARWLTDPASLAGAMRAFAGQRRPGDHALSPQDAARLLAARMIRINVTEVSGRACTTPEAPDEEHEVETHDAHDDVHAHQSAVSAAELEREAERALDGVRRLGRALRVTGHVVPERDDALSPAQLFVLRQLAERPYQSLTELAGHTQTTRSSVSEVVARLVERGLVSRETSPEDRRRVELTLTARGESSVAQAPETAQERLTAAYRTLSDDHRHALLEALGAWLDAAGLGHPVGTMPMEHAAED